MHAVALAGLAVAAGCREQDQPTPTPPVAPAPPKPAPNSPTAKAFYADHFSKRPSIPAVVELGRTLFFDASLSASGKMSCATCHDPRFAYGPPNARAVQLGGPDMTSPGLRAVPSLRYLQKLPPFSEHHLDEATDDSTDQGPAGGHTWDGRVNTTHDQARLPLTSPFEMANKDIAGVVTRVANGPLAARFRDVFGDDVFADPTRGEIALLTCLEDFQQMPKDFYPYTSKYDAYLRRQTTLSAAEERGRVLFNDPKKANCASCHPSGVREGQFPAFTDFGYNALGVPRNREIPANKDPAYRDLGLCGPLRTDLASHREYCGEFRVPALRNVAVRRTFFHNGAFHKLDQVIAFYLTRDTTPGRWYPKTNGQVDLYDDLPAEDRKNVNRDPPFGGKPGAAPGLNKGEVADLIAFLKTLTDADQKPAP